jgi:hypothetical protein
MNNKLLSYKAFMFHAQNVPVANRFRWTKFICALGSEEESFETLTEAAGIPAALSLNSLVNELNDVLYVLTDNGILYVDHAERKIKPTSKTDQNFTWGIAFRDRTWFSGPGLGLWYANRINPYTIVHAGITSGGEFSGIGYRGAGWSTQSPNLHSFFSDIGWFAYDYYGDKSVVQVTGYSNLKHFRGSDGTLAFGATGQGNEGIWTINPQSPAQIISSGNFRGSARGPDSSALIFKEGGGIYRGTGLNSYGAVSEIASAGGIEAYHGVIAQNNKLYLCTDAGIKRYNESTVALDDTNISSGLFHWCEVAEDGNLYFCGEDGVFRLDNDTEIISPLAETNEYLQCTLGDGKFYFRDGQNVKRFTIPHNTGASVAEELKLYRSKFGKETELGTFSMLDYIQPHITVNSLRRMSQPDVLQRAANLLEAVPKPARYTAPPDAAYNPDSAEMCPLGEYGAVSHRIWASVMGSFSYQQNNIWRADNGAYLGQGSTVTRVTHIWYVDNISSFTGSSTIRIIASVNGLQSTSTSVIGLIDYPPEEWNITPNSTESYYAVRSKMASNARTKTIPGHSGSNSFILEIPVNEIYNGPDAKTLVCYAPSEYTTTVMLLTEAYIDDQKWTFKLYRVCIFEWSDRVCQQDNSANTGNAIAKTLTLTIPTFGSEIFSILDAFGSYPAIDETAYAAMSDTAISERATALMNYAAGLQGQTKYRKNNEVIEYNTAACPVT